MILMLVLLPRTLCSRGMPPLSFVIKVFELLGGVVSFVVRVTVIIWVTVGTS